MSANPGEETDGADDSPAEFDRDLRCYQCDHRYGYFGGGHHPGVCPNCGGRLVSFAGEPRAVAPGARRAATGGEELSPVFKVVVRDATDRRFEYVVAFSERESGESYPLLRHVRVGDRQTAPNGDGWDEELLPDCLLHAVREMTGRGLLLPSRDSVDDWDDGDDDEGGIGATQGD